MDVPGIERIPRTWDDRVDVPFFTLTAGLFRPDFCLGASVLLAGNDEDASRLVRS